MAKIIICKDCGERKPHVARGLCNRCYRNYYKQENPQRIKVINRRYRENGEKAKATWHRWWERNRDKHNARHYQYRKENPEKVRADLRRWRRNNPEKKAAQDARRKACKYNVGNTLTSEQLEYEMNIGRAMYPGEKLHVHHIVPLSKGGGHTWGNIMVIPASLNLSIRDKLPQEVYRQLCFV